MDALPFDPRADSWDSFEMRGTPVVTVVTDARAQEESTLGCLRRAISAVSDHDACVVSTKAKAVAKGHLVFPVAGGICRVIEVACRIGSLEIDRWRDDPVLKRLDA